MQKFFSYMIHSLLNNQKAWKRPLRSSSATVNPTSLCSPPNHFPKCHIQMCFERLEGCWFYHFLGQSIPMPHHTFSGWCLCPIHFVISRYLQWIMVKSFRLLRKICVKQPSGLLQSPRISMRATCRDYSGAEYKSVSVSAKTDPNPNWDSGRLVTCPTEDLTVRYLSQGFDANSDLILSLSPGSSASYPSLIIVSLTVTREGVACFFHKLLQSGLQAMKIFMCTFKRVWTSVLSVLEVRRDARIHHFLWASISICID